MNKRIFDAESALLAIPDIVSARFTATDAQGRMIFACLISNGTTEVWAVKEKARTGDQPLPAASSI